MSLIDDDSIDYKKYYSLGLMWYYYHSDNPTECASCHIEKSSMLRTNGRTIMCFDCLWALMDEEAREDDEVIECPGCHIVKNTMRLYGKKKQLCLECFCDLLFE